MIDWHAFWAAWNWGEEGSIRLGPPCLPPIRNRRRRRCWRTRGRGSSGRRGSACTARTSALVPATSPVPRARGLASLGRQLCAGLARGLELRRLRVDAGHVAVVVAAVDNRWPSLGSGNSGTPCVRMQCENAMIFCWALALLSLSGEDEPPPRVRAAGSAGAEVRDAGARGGAAAAGERHAAVASTARVRMVLVMSSISFTFA